MGYGYKVSIKVDIEFEYYPFQRTTNEEVPFIVNHNETDYYCEAHDIEITITPKMLLEAIDYVYADKFNNHDSKAQRYDLQVALEQCPYYFEKICAEIFNEDNLDYLSNYYDYLRTTDEFKKEEEKIIKNEAAGLGELYE